MFDTCVLHMLAIFKR